MFAASFSTLKKRTSQLLKGEEGAGRRGDGDLDGLEAVGVPENVSSFAPIGQIIVRYEVQNGPADDRDAAAFLLAVPEDGTLTGGLIRKKFPMPGQFHFRFKTPTSDGSFGGWVWVDLANDAEYAPIFRGEVYMKVLKLPDGAASRSHRSLSGGQTFASQQPAPLQGGLGATVEPARPRVAAPPAASQPSLFEEAATLPRGAASPPPPPDDLMELGVASCASPSMSSPMGSPGGGSPSRSPPTPAPPPVVIPDRQTLVAQREAAERARVEEANRIHNERRDSEEQLRKDKLSMSNKLYAEMDAWAKTADGQSFKDIRTLLSTVHTVIWPNSGWDPLSLSELVAKDSNVKRYYRKAILMCHPDKQQEAAPEQQVRADRIFQALNEAFKASGDS
mmetsp:Transcript_17350/g.52310  ORF Transcript_17350/g.52310 Transcript_17350/m.52310 type:complete len:392 (+) Transcript_17350:91-1266(+)